MKKAVLTPNEAYRIMFCEYPDVVDVDGMRSMLGGIGRSTAYRLLKKGEVDAIRLGRMYMIPKISVISYICGDVARDSTN